MVASFLSFPMKLLVVCIQMPCNNKRLILFTTLGVGKRWTAKNDSPPPISITIFTKTHTSAEEREISELSRGVISTTIPLGENIYQDQWEKMWGSPALKIPSLLSELLPKFRTQRPKSFSNTRNIPTWNHSCPGIPRAPHRGREAHNLPTTGIHPQTGNSLNGDYIRPLQECPRFRYDWTAQWSHMCTWLTRRGTGGVLEGGRENPSLRAASSWRSANFQRAVASWRFSSLGGLSITYRINFLY